VRHQSKDRLPVRAPPLGPGERIIWLAHLGGRGDHLFPVPGVVVSGWGKHIRIAVQVYGGGMVTRVVRLDRVLPAR